MQRLEFRLSSSLLLCKEDMGEARGMAFIFILSTSCRMVSFTSLTYHIMRILLRRGPKRLRDFSSGQGLGLDVGAPGFKSWPQDLRINVIADRLVYLPASKKYR